MKLGAANGYSNKTFFSYCSIPNPMQIRRKNPQFLQFFTCSSYNSESLVSNAIQYPESLKFPTVADQLYQLNSINPWSITQVQGGQI